MLELDVLKTLVHSSIIQKSIELAFDEYKGAKAALFIEKMSKRVYVSWERIEKLRKQAGWDWTIAGKPTDEFKNPNPAKKWFDGHCNGWHIGKDIDAYYLYTPKGWRKCPNIFQLKNVKSARK